MATLKVNITESITLNGSNYGAKNTLSVSGINEVDKRVISVTNASNGTQIYAGAAAAGQGTFVHANVKYVRITNMDSSNFVTLHLEHESGGGHYCQFKLEAGKSFILGNSKIDDDDDIDDFVAVDIDKIEAKADTAAVKLEVYVATA